MPGVFTCGEGSVESKKLAQKVIILFVFTLYWSVMMILSMFTRYVDRIVLDMSW